MTYHWQNLVSRIRKQSLVRCKWQEQANVTKPPVLLHGNLFRGIHDDCTSSRLCLTLYDLRISADRYMKIRCRRAIPFYFEVLHCLKLVRACCPFGCSIFIVCYAMNCISLVLLQEWFVQFILFKRNGTTNAFFKMCKVLLFCKFISLGGALWWAYLKYS